MQRVFSSLSKVSSVNRSIQNCRKFSSVTNVKGGFYGVANDIWTERKSEYLPNRGVFLAPMLSKSLNDKFGFYRGKILPNSQISTEFHNGTTETIYILNGTATGIIDGKEFPLKTGDVMHVKEGFPHGIKNSSKSQDLEILVIGNPDF